MSTPRTATDVLDAEFLKIRARLLDLAASLDRIRRAEGSVAEDARWRQVLEAVAMLQDDTTLPRATELQLLFSLPYESAWRATFGITSDR